jgi:hypothetical protein
MNCARPRWMKMGVPSARFPATHHSRAVGNADSFSIPVGLDTPFAGMTE